MLRFSIVVALSMASVAIASDNVDVAATAKSRVNHMRELVTFAVDELDETAASDAKKNTVLFLMRVAWHEGSQLTARRQNGGGPGRSFFQFEPAKAKDGVDYAVTKKVIGDIAATAGSTSKRVEDSAKDLVLGSPWPNGGLIEKLLGGENEAVDLFGIYLARVCLKRIPAAIPTDLAGQAEYWAKHWKVKFDSDADRTAKINQFKDNAAKLDGHL
jgi:hypothetical protein